MVVSWVVSWLALIAADAVLSGFTADSVWTLALVAAVTGVVGALVRPVLVTGAAVIGWLAVAALAVVGQGVVMLLAMAVVPGVHASFWTAVAATWIVALVSTALQWLLAAGTGDAFGVAVSSYAGKPATVDDPDVDGMVFVQVDGLPYPVASWALQSGSMPTLRRWIDDGSHRLLEWTVQLPCTTPASQQGILHGTCRGVPAFRWYDRELGRVLVANRPADAAIIESRASNGAGLLADGGVSISNLFSGDAPTSHVTMSRVGLSRGSSETRKTFARFVARPDGFSRSLTRTTAEVFKERFQARQQRRRDVVPRVHRSWTYAFLRAVSNGVMRDLNTALVAREMRRGTRSIYVDYVDYDEVAHHAGGNRIEALRVLESLDEVLAVLEDVAKDAPRRYRFVVLSDHGQAQGAPFAERAGKNLSDLCRELTEEGVDAAEENVESWGRAESLAEDLADEDAFAGRTSAGVASRLRKRTAADGEDNDLVVLGSGNLGLVYVRQPNRMTLEELDVRWPQLVSGLAAQAGIGFVAVMSSEHGPMVIGADGFHRLRDGFVQGVDPLAPFPSHAAWALLEAVSRDEAPDVYVNSIVDASTSEIAAFEELVGSHGGLGGWQDRGTFVPPADLVADGTAVRGAEDLHQLLVQMLRALGQREKVVHDADV
jgi:uncharacterized membrane protein YvlD (DUF360 family)